MSPQRTAVQTPVVAQRRAVAATIQRSHAPAAHEVAVRSTQRVAGQAAPALIARALAGPAAAAPAPTAPVHAVATGSPTGAPQLLAKVSSPGDPAELEAEQVARNVVKIGVPLSTPRVDDHAHPHVVHRSVDRTGPAPHAAPVDVGVAGGAPLPAGVRGFMEPRFGADFGNVRIHTGEAAAEQSASMQAHAFTVGQHIFFGRGQYQPDSVHGKELIAHELTHTVQQGGSVQHGGVVHRSADTAVSQRSEPRIQRLGIGDALNTIADKANYIPGFRLLTIVLGMNPVNQAPVERSAANLLRALLEMIPVTGALLAQALENHGIFAKAGAWVEAQVKALGMVGSAFKQALDKFLDSLNWRDIFDLGGVWERAKRIFTEPIDRLLAFGRKLATDILGFIRGAILLPLAKLAEGTRGYDLLKAVLGQDPISGQPCPRNADTLIGGFMKLIGQEEIWQNLKKANAVARAWAWFQGALAGLLGFVKQIPMLALNAFKALEVADLILVPRAFAKIAGVFGGFIVQFIGWAGNTIWRLLEIIFEVVSPALLGYLRKTGEALKNIIKNPVPFVRNLVRAAVLGFQHFADNFGTHLKAGLINWLTGSLPGVYIPTAFTLGEIVKFVFSVLGLTWQNIRPKLVKVVGETAVKAMETGFDIVVTLVTKGPAAAWDKIQDQLSNLKDQVIGGITDFVVDTIVKKAVPKLIAMFIPGAGFISAIVSIYDTIMVFVDKLAKIAAVVKSFVDSIVAIAGGAIEAAAKRVESTLAGLLSLAISFLAGFLGLGNIAEKIMGVITKIRATIDKAVDALIAWVVKMAKALFAKVFGKGDKPDERTDAQKASDLHKGVAEAKALLANKQLPREKIIKQLSAIQTQYKITTLALVTDSKSAASETDHIHGAINPEEDSGPVERPPGESTGVEVQTVTVDDKAAATLLRPDITGKSFELGVKQQLLTEPLFGKTAKTPGLTAVGGPVGAEIQKQFPQTMIFGVGTPAEESLGDRREAQKTREQATAAVGAAPREAFMIFQQRHKDPSDPSGKTFGVPDATLKVFSEKSKESAVILVEITLIRSITEVADEHAVRKASQLNDTVLRLKGEYKDEVPIQYHLITPAATDEQQRKVRAFLEDIIRSSGLKKIKFVWTMLSS